GFDPIINGRCHSFEVVRAMVEAGCSVSINPGLRGRDYIGRLLLKEIRPAIARRIFVTFRSGELRNPAVAGFVEALRAVATSMDNLTVRASTGDSDVSVRRP
ncbi:MAG: LysR substrate-binding domain-containing protein, partial [Phenylobacterium sp.]